ncbi:MAG TPA: hypothetical protein VI278_06740 [Nitrososphaeraceae archaeon]
MLKIESTATDNFYDPSPSNASIGSTVTWINKDSTIHTVTWFYCQRRISSFIEELFTHA